MKIGIVGLPNVGKSTLFTALTKKEVPRENYPFCTIDPNIGVVTVPDDRLGKLAKISKSKETIPTVIEFVDIAGLVSGAHKGEGLGNQFLSHIKEVDAICQVVRVFADDNVHHVSGKIEAAEDIATINLELVMSDLTLISKRIDDLEGKARTGEKEAATKLDVLIKLKQTLDDGRLANQTVLTDDELKLTRDLNLLTLKPILYIFNVNTQVDDDISARILTQYKDAIKPFLGLVLNVQQEAELSELDDDEVGEYLRELGLKESGLEKLIHNAYKLLNLITFFTSGEMETRAWTVRAGALAPHAAGKIHSDIEQGFIRAEVVNWKEFVEVGGWNPAKDKGLMRLEGKEYVTKEGDVCYFRFAV